MEDFFNTPIDSVFYEDHRLFVALAYKPLTIGHTVVVWKKDDKDINLLPTEDYEYLMDVVDVARETLKEFYNVEKVYLMYLDEAEHVHWHLIPRYNEMGFNVLNHDPETITSFPDAEALKELFRKLQNQMMIER